MTDEILWDMVAGVLLVQCGYILYSIMWDGEKINAFVWTDMWLKLPIVVQQAYHSMYSVTTTETERSSRCLTGVGQKAVTLDCFINTGAVEAWSTDSLKHYKSQQGSHHYS